MKKRTNSISHLRFPLWPLGWTEKFDSLTAEINACPAGAEPFGGGSREGEDSFERGCAGAAEAFERGSRGVREGLQRPSRGVAQPFGKGSIGVAKAYGRRSIGEADSKKSGRSVVEDSKKGLGSCGWLRWAAVIAVMLAWMMPAMAQDYTGIYYIASVGNGSGNNANNYTYNAETPANNFYLCTADEYCFYKPVDDFAPNNQGTTYPNPFLTTYKCRDGEYELKYAVWTIEKDPNTGYYYIKQTETGKYILSNGKINSSNNADRIRVHLQEVDIDTLSDPNMALFNITPSGDNLVIQPMGITDATEHDNNTNWAGHSNHAGHRWLTVNNGNYNMLKGHDDKPGGPTGYTGTAGLIGLYTKTDSNAPFRLERATIDPPTITENFNDGTITITSVQGATIYYTTDGTTPTTATQNTATTNITFQLQDGMTVIKAIAKGSSDYFASIVSTYDIPQCDSPVFSVVGNVATLICITPGSSIYYDFGESSDEPETPYHDPFTLPENSITRAIAKAVGYRPSEVVYYYNYPPTTVQSSEEITNMVGSYILADGFTSVDPIGTADAPFKGTIDGNYKAFTLDGHALIGVAKGAILKNIVVKRVSYSADVDDMGAIVNTAKGGTKIYNCGVQGGIVKGGINTGGLVGRIVSGSSVRVVNCYNFANVSSGGGANTYAAGIVGRNEGSVSTGGTVGNVRIALCMMYGNVTNADHISPVYGGNHQSNVSNFTEYNYWRYRAVLPYTALNDQLPVEEDEYLTRFPFFRHILNSQRKMAAFFLFGAVSCNNMSDILEGYFDEIGHWVLKKDVADYPIIEPWPKNTQTTPTSTNTNFSNISGDYAGRLLANMGSRGYLGVKVIIKNREYNVSLPITDMDTLNYDFTWGKVVLPFANEFSGWEINYDEICTGWQITSVNGGTPGTFSTTTFDVSDRNCTNKDLYSNTGFVFAQGGNFIVPYGVTNIKITANFATAYYLCDESYEIAYAGYGTATGAGENAAGYKGRTGLAGTAPNLFHNKPVYHTLNAALGHMSASGSVHEQAIVLIGNYHWDGETISGDMLKKGYTIMSIDEDNNQEPDYALYSNHTVDRPEVPPTRYDFIAQVPLGMSSHLHGSVHYPNIPIWKPHGWFEITETSISRAHQFELDSNNFNSSDDTKNYRCIINGGYFTQMVRGRKVGCQKVSYYQIGGKAYIKEFYPGNHSQSTWPNKLVPINVTGGEIEQCFMTGYGKGKAYGTDIYFWCAGGRIHKFLGAYMEPPVRNSSTIGNVNLTAKIDHARIYRFFGGGTTSKARITGNIKVTVNNSLVDFYCGGPEFGDMVSGKTVTTEAKNTTFREFYGAGFGGTAISYTNDRDVTLEFNTTSNFTSGTTDLPYPNDYFGSCYLNSSDTIGRLDYKPSNGIGNCYKYEYIMHSRGYASVARFYTGYASFSLAKTGSVTNTLENCTVGRFYGAGCQGTVDGTVTSTLKDCTIQHSAFGGGYKAVSNEVQVYSATQTSPRSIYHGESSIFSDFGPIPPSSKTFTWVQGNEQDHDKAVEADSILYTGTNVTLDDLGNVIGAITLTLDGETRVAEDVFGGGNESKSLDNATVIIKGTSSVSGNVYGGGNKAKVEKNATVKLQQGATIGGNVYGGGNEGEVFGSSEVKIQNE